MIHWKDIKTVHVDGFLYGTAAFFGSIEITLSSDAAYKYVDPYLLFWGRGLSAAILATATGLIAFRSKVFSDHKAQENASVTTKSETETTIVKQTKEPTNET